MSGERDFGLDSRIPQGRIEIIFRLRQNNRLRVDYFATNRSGDHVINRTILFGDETFVANDRVTSNLDWRQFALTYTYSLFRNDYVEAGLGLGVHFVEADARGAVNAKQLRQEVSGSGAFPTIPLDFTWRIWHGLALSARGQYFHASVNNFEGSIAEYHGDFQWRWNDPNFSLGAGYTIMRSSLDIDDTNFPGSFRLNVRGPEGFLQGQLLGGSRPTQRRTHLGPRDGALARHAQAARQRAPEASRTQAGTFPSGLRIVQLHGISP